MKPQLTYKQRLEVGAALAPLLRDECPRRVKLVNAAGAVVGERTIQIGRAVLAKAAVAFGDIRGKCVDCRKPLSRSAPSMGSIRCAACAHAAVKKHRSLCPDCGKELNRSVGSRWCPTRCFECHTQARHANQAVPLCRECGISLKSPRASRCKPCVARSLRKPISTCLVCGVQIQRGAERCAGCAPGARRVPLLTCRDCGTSLSKSAAWAGSVRCRRCGYAARVKSQPCCVDCGTPLSRSATRCRLCANRFRWRQMKKPRLCCTVCGKTLHAGARWQGTKNCRSCAATICHVRRKQ